MDDRNAPASKGDIADLRVGVKGDIADLRVEVKGDIADLRAEMKEKFDQMSAEANHRYNDLVERMSDGETRLLKAFYSFSQSNQKRMVEIEGNQAAIINRIGTLEGRILEIEKRLNLPPAA